MNTLRQIVAQASDTGPSLILLAIGIGLISGGAYQVWKILDERGRGEYIHREAGVWFYAILMIGSGVGLMSYYATNGDW